MKISFFIAASLAVITLVFHAPAARATSCMIPSCMEEMSRHDLVFRGKAIASGATTAAEQEKFARGRPADEKADTALPDTYTDFQVLSLYKGLAGAKARIYYAQHRRGPIVGDFDVKAYPDGTETVIYASGRDGFYMTYRGLCSGCQGDGQLETIKVQYDAIENLIAENPKIAEFYQKKVELYDANKDYAAAAATYERGFAAQPGLKDKPGVMADYGRILFLARRYADAVKVLEPVKSDTAALSYLQQSLLHLDAKNTVSGKLEMAGKEIAKLTISDRDLSGSDFTGARLNGVRFVNVKLKNANFTNAVMNVIITGSDLAGAKLDGAHINGQITDSNFDKASLKSAVVEMHVAGGNSFRDADFTAAAIYIMDCRGTKDWRGSDFTGARFKDARVSGLGQSKLAGADFTNTTFYVRKCMSQNQGIDLSGRKFDNTAFDLGNYAGASFKGASLRNTTFGGDDLTGADFSGADLTGASFLNTSYSGPVKLLGADFTGAKIDNVDWSGAMFDCKTKFPPGFKPEDHRMITKDRSCASAATRNPGVVNYDREYINRGYMTVCNGDYHADCIYGFLASFHGKAQDWSYQDGLVRLAESFIDAGYPELARIIALKMIGATALSRHSLDPKYYGKWLPLMEKIDAAQPGKKTPAADAPATPADVSRALRRAQESMMAQGGNISVNRAGFALGEVAVKSADAGDFESARAYAAAIGSDEYNREVLRWRDDVVQNRSSDSDYTRRQGRFAADMMIALERQQQKGDAQKTLDDLIESSQRKPQGRDQQMFAAAAMLAGMDSPRPDLVAAAYAATGRVDSAWEIYNHLHDGNDPSTKLSVLAALAGYYADHPGDSGIRKMTDALKTYAIVRWPQHGDMIYGGIEVGIHEKLFAVLGALKSKKAFAEIMPLIDAYPDSMLRSYAQLYAAAALASAGEVEKGFEYFEKARAAISDTAPPEGRRVPRYIIMLHAGGGQTAKTQDFPVTDTLFGDFIFSVAISGATGEQKQKALKAGDALMAAGKAGSPQFIAQMAVAKALVNKDAGAEQKMMDAFYGVPASAFADLLHQAGFHDTEKKLIEASWISGDAPPGIGLERLGYRTGMQTMMHGQQLAVLAGMLARDGHFDEAARVADTIFDSSAVQRLGGTDFVTYLARERTLYYIAVSAMRQGKPDIAAGIADKDVTYTPYKAAVYFALARAQNANDARKAYDLGYALTPSFGAAMGAPLLDADGLAIAALLDRAAVEKALGLEDRYAQTLSYASRALDLAQGDAQRGKVVAIFDRIKQLGAGKDASEKPGIEEFIKTLQIRDDLNSTSVVKEMADKYLAEGDKERARAVALYGFRNIDNYPQAHGKNTVLLPYAHIIALTEPRMSAEAQEKIGAILREVHANTPGGKDSDVMTGVDFVAEGAVAYKELLRRMALDDAPANDGDLANQYRRDGTFGRGGQQLMQQWLTGAMAKYNAAHPDAPATMPSPIPQASVITRDITLPTREYGGAFRGYFIVPSDVPRPKGHRHDSTIFYMSDFTCEGNYQPYCRY